MKRFNILLIVFLSATGFFQNANAALTASQVMSKAAAKVMPAAPYTFNYTASGQWNGKGTFVVEGKKFYLDMGKNKVWYNGAVMTTLNLSNNEATTVTPSGTEVREVNPLAYIGSWKTDYNAAFAKGKAVKGKYTIVLTANKAKALAKKVIVTVNSGNFLPEKLVISVKQGGMLTLNITSVRSGGKSTASNFLYPKNKYPKVEIVDLR